MSYEAGDATFVTESWKKGKRSTQYECNLYPKERSGSLSASLGTISRILYRFDMVTLTKDQILKVYVYDTEDSGTLCLQSTPMTSTGHKGSDGVFLTKHSEVVLSLYHKTD